MTKGERIKELRQTLGLTLEEFGNNIGVSHVAISFRLPRTTQNEVVENTIKLCELLLKSVK